MKTRVILGLAAACVIAAGAPASSLASSESCGGTYVTVVNADGTKGKRCYRGCPQQCTCIAAETCPDAIKPYPE